SSKDGGRTYSDIPGATGGTLSLRNLSTLASGTLVRAAFTTSDGTVYSAGARLQVNPRPSLGDWDTTRGTVGVGFDDSLQILGGTAPFVVSTFTGFPRKFTQPLITEVTIIGPDGSSKDETLLTVRFTPERPGTYRGIVTVTDKAGISVTRAVTFTIAP